MRITVEYAAQAKEAAGTAAEEVEVEPRCSVQQLGVRLGEQHGDPLRRLLLNTNGRGRKKPRFMAVPLGPPTGVILAL